MNGMVVVGAGVGEGVGVVGGVGGVGVVLGVIVASSFSAKVFLRCNPFLS